MDGSTINESPKPISKLQRNLPDPKLNEIGKTWQYPGTKSSSLYAVSRPKVSSHKLRFEIVEKSVVGWPVGLQERSIRITK
jgi:hypothetical protein